MRMPDTEGDVTPIPGARPLRPGDLEDLWPQEKHDQIVNRVKYLVHDDLEEPPHIVAARQVLTQRGGDWRSVSDAEILDIVDQLPRRLFDGRIWRRYPHPPPDSEYHDLIARIHKSELDFYGFDSSSAGGRFLYMLRDAKYDPDPASFYQRLKQAGLAIDKVVHFTRPTPEVGNVQLISLPLRIEKRRELFVDDMARFLAQMQGVRGEIPHTTYTIPAKDDEYIEKGIMRTDGRTLVFDTTLNGSILQAIQEANFKPAVIVREFTFWRDGADEDAAALDKAAWAEYTTTHWLTQYYDVYERHPGSGFVSCNPTIYIRKGRSLVHALKRSASNLVRRGTSRAA